MSTAYQSYPKWLNVLLIIVLMLGIFLRFENLDQKFLQADSSIEVDYPAEVKQYQISILRRCGVSVASSTLSPPTAG
jgi:hypothetical protein